MNKKSLIIIISVILVCTCAVGVSLAYLTSVTDEVTNTFVAADFANLSLTETSTTDYDSNTSNYDYLVVPGLNITKDPKITFAPEAGEDNLVDAYVFVKMEASGWTTADNVTFTKTLGSTAGALSFEVDTAYWNFLEAEGGSYVYYKALTAAETINAQSVIKGDSITVSTAITEADLDTATNGQTFSKIAGGDLIFSGYAIQQIGFEGNVSGAWDEVSGQAQANS